MSGQGIEREIGRVSRHHVQRTAGMSLGMRLEITGGQFAALQPDLACIGHVRNQPHGSAGETIDRSQPAIRRGRVLHGAVLHQRLRQCMDARLGQRVVDDDAITCGPLGERGVRGAIAGGCSFDPKSRERIQLAADSVGQQAFFRYFVAGHG